MPLPVAHPAREPCAHTIVSPAPYTSLMRSVTVLLLISSLTGCGMQGDLYEPAPPAEPVAAPEPAPETTDKGERKTNPTTPDPAKSL
jgi:predicted small lipoprotein YifL